MATVLALAACSSSNDDLPDTGGGGGQSAGDPPVDNLDDVGVGGDESVADDQDSIDPDSVSTANDPVENPFNDVPGDLEDMTNPSPTAEEMPAPPDDSAVDAPEEPDPEDPAGGFVVNPLDDTGSGPLPRTAPKNPAWFSAHYDCPHNPLNAKCVCRGSPYNCQIPNNQPGRNRYLPPTAVHELNATSASDTRQEIIARLGRWSSDPTTPIFDGKGTALGNVTSGCYTAVDGSSSLTINPADTGHPCVKINFGIVKHMTTSFDANTVGRYVFAYDASIHTTDGGDGTGTGWVPLSRITNDRFHPYNTPPRKPKALDNSALVLKSAEDYGCSAESWDPKTCLPSWASLQVAPNSKSSPAASYLLRLGNMQTLAYSTPLVGGAGTDVVRVARNSTQFARAKSVDSAHATILRIGLYTPGTTQRVRSMYFVYGRVAHRWGWVPAFALKKGKVDDSGGTIGTGACTGQPDGVYCNPLLAFAGFVCKGGQVAQNLSCPDSSMHCVGPNDTNTDIVCQ